MLKKDLKHGDIVEIEWKNMGAKRYLLLSNGLLRIGGYVPLERVNDDLTCSYENGDNTSSRITKVFRTISGHCGYDLEDIFEDENLEVVWEEKKKIVMSEKDFLELVEYLDDITGTSCPFNYSCETSRCIDCWADKLNKIIQY